MISGRFYCFLEWNVPGRSRMPPATLFSICVQKTCNFLRGGVWEQCLENPFSTLPSSIIQELLATMLPAHRKLSRASIGHSRLLLASGRLECVNLFDAEQVEDYVSLFRKLSLGCQNLRTLILPQLMERSNRHVEWALKDLIKNSTNLEEIHSNFYFDPDVLRNFTQLRSLRLHFCDEEAVKFTRSVTSDILQSLGAIEVLAICVSIHFQTVTEETDLVPCIARILDNCPRLISVGYLNSSTALEQLEQRHREANHHFQLRSCYWISQYSTTSSRYCNMIKVASESCPLLEVLVIKVSDAGCLKHLKALTYLTSLDIDFYECENKYDQKFYSLLKEIGSRLQYLSLYGYMHKQLDLNVICGHCPNLTTLNIESGLTADEDVNLMNLKRLDANELDRGNLLFLLSNCLHLQVLYLHSCEQLDDDVLQEILRKNCFAELEVAHINESSLSLSGLTSFIQSVSKLREFSLGSPAFLNDDDVVQCVWNLNPNVKCYPLDRFYMHYTNEFRRNNEGCCGF